MLPQNVETALRAVVVLVHEAVTQERNAAAGRAAPEVGAAQENASRPHVRRIPGLIVHHRHYLHLAAGAPCSDGIGIVNRTE